MGLFYKIPPKKLLAIKNDIFLYNGIPALKKNGFTKMPFPETLYGKNNLGYFTYELCRLSPGSRLEIITTHIARGDRWIQIYLNIFEIKPVVTSLAQLNNINGMQFRLPPNSITSMRLRSDDFKGIPLFNTIRHKIKFYFTEKGFQKRAAALSTLIDRDLNNIDSFVKRWHELHVPLITDWGGNKVN